MRMRWTGRQALMTGCCLLAGLLGVWLGEAVGRQGPELWLLSPALEALLLAPAAVLACRFRRHPGILLAFGVLLTLLTAGLHGLWDPLIPVTAFLSAVVAECLRAMGGYYGRLGTVLSCPFLPLGLLGRVLTLWTRPETCAGQVLLRTGNQPLARDLLNLNTPRNLVLALCLTLGAGILSTAVTMLLLERPFRLSLRPLRKRLSRLTGRRVRPGNRRKKRIEK